MRLEPRDMLAALKVRHCSGCSPRHWDRSGGKLAFGFKGGGRDEEDEEDEEEALKE